MKYLTYIFLAVPLFVHAQKSTISGTIKDANSGEYLIGASIYNTTSSQGTTANTYGFFSLTLNHDSVSLRVSYVGFEPSVLKFYLQKDTVLNITLMGGTHLQEIEINATAGDNIHESTQMSSVDIPISHIKALPAFMGETDLIKVLQLLPGVQSGTEGSSGLYVRGGGPDQNLILLDGVPVYNAAHLFGFFSVFNTDAINHVELIKGGFPARYGGRLSSVVDISMKEGNSKKIQGEGSIGLIASRLTVEGPLIKDKTSFIVSARRTYIDILARPLIKAASKGETVAGYFFYDLNTKINHKINDNNKIYLSAYMGDDKAYARNEYNYNFGSISEKEVNESGLKWGNVTTALRWNKIITNKLFANLTATYSRYRFSVFSETETDRTINGDKIHEYVSGAYISGIRDHALKLDFDYIPSPDHYIKFGAQAINHRFSPGVLSYRAEEQRDTTLGAKRLYGQELYGYIEDDFRINDKLKINAGIHASAFLVNGKTYHSFQPRISGRYLLTPLISIKGSYATMAQYIHLLTNSGIGLPTDLWVPATEKIRPEQSSISALGIAYTHKKMYEFSIEGFYKEMDGLIEYKDGASFIDIEEDWQEKVEIGKGESYGAEVFLQKKTGRVSGWIGYTLSWTNRTFKNINAGKTFPYRYDRRHDLKITAAYNINKKKDLSLTWVYGTGNAVTLPNASYEGASENPQWFWNSDVKQYDGRNNYRMRNYHRLDLSYTITKVTKFGERSWSFGIYNVYSRRNPFYLDISSEYNHQTGAQTKKFVQYSLFPIIPSIAYRFKF